MTRSQVVHSLALLLLLAEPKELSASAELMRKFSEQYAKKQVDRKHFGRGSIVLGSSLGAIVVG